MFRSSTDSRSLMVPSFPSRLREGPDIRADTMHHIGQANKSLRAAKTMPYENFTRSYIIWSIMFSCWFKRMNQQDKNNEILRLLNCLEPYTSEFKSMQRDIEFALQTFGKIHQDSYVSVIHLISEEKEKNKKNNFVRQDTVTSISDLIYEPHKGIIKFTKNILIYQYAWYKKRNTIRTIFWYQILEKWTRESL